MENNNPVNPTGGALLIKLGVGLIIGGLMALVIFMMFMLL
jgi:hypothetical protein